MGADVGQIKKNSASLGCRRPKTIDTACHRKIAYKKKTTPLGSNFTMTNTDIWMISLTALVAVAGIISATIFNKQLSVMQGQLDEMKATGRQNEILIETNKTLANAAKQSAEAASASVGAFIDSERGRMFISEIKLTNKDGNDPQPTIDYTFVNVGRGAVVLIQVAIECELIGSEISRNIALEPTKVYGANIPVASGAFIGNNTKPAFLPPCPPFRTPLTADYHANIAAKKASILVRGFIRYRTGLDDIYRRNFANVYGAHGDYFSELTIPGSNEEYREPNRK
jgi:hypothetical protein